MPRCLRIDLGEIVHHVLNRRTARMTLSAKDEGRGISKPDPLLRKGKGGFCPPRARRRRVEPALPFLHLLQGLDAQQTEAQFERAGGQVAEAQP